MKHRTTADRKSERKLAISRTFDAPVRVVFEAWTSPEIFTRWWIPKSMGMTVLACEMDARTGGRYRLEISHPAFDKPMTFFGRYLEVIPNARLVWTNEESGGGAVTTVTFEERDGKTELTLSELYPTKEALDEALEGSAAGLPEQFAELEALLNTLGASEGPQ
ncbi:MAG: SRPBCC domain-containing protein [Alphaproteobacteria bacterium]|nr:SRPBCC domain-containing protein [Alphaproteobacteria bacterium]